MASRHVFTQRLKSGVIFSAPGNLLAMPEGDWGDDTLINRQKKPKRKVQGRGLDHFSHWIAKVSLGDEPYDNVDSFTPGKDTRGIGKEYRPYSISPYPEAKVETAAAKIPEVTLCLPMLSVSLTATVEGTIAHTELVQKFHNPSDIAIDAAKHVFPLYDGAVITSFECTIGDERRVRGVVKPKVQARKEYEEAVRDKVAAPALLEEHTPEIFETSLGNIPADTTVEIRITYVQELNVVMMESEATEGIALTIPMSNAPRYSKAPIEWEPASRVPEEKLDIWIKVMDNGKVNHEGCDEESGHLLQFEGSKPAEYSNLSERDAAPRNYYVWHHESEPPILRKDFVFVIQMNEGHQIKSRAIACQADDKGFGAMMVNIRPNDLFRNAIIPQSFTGEILFLLDQSGSMGWTNGSPDYGRRRTGARKIDVMREAMLLALSGIPSTCAFNVISWGSATMGLWETSRPHTKENIREAKTYVSQVEADMGGTDLLRALESTVKRRVQDRESTQIIILTDGELEPEDPIQVIWKKRQLLGDSIRFFALGIGDEVSHRLVESIAECGGGYSDVVHTTQTPRWHDRLNRLLKSALEPNSWSCDIDLGSGFERNNLVDYNIGQDNPSGGDKTPYIQAPFPISSLHPFSFASISFLIDLRYGGQLPKAVTISTTTASAKKKTYELPIEQAPGNDSTTHCLVAKSVLLDLQDEIKRGTGETQIAKTNAEYIGTTYSITSKWTSFVAVSENQPAQTVEEQKMNHYKALFDEIDIDELLNNVSDDKSTTSSFSRESTFGAIPNFFETRSDYNYGRQLESANPIPILSPIPVPYALSTAPMMRSRPNSVGKTGHPQPPALDPKAELSIDPAPLSCGQCVDYLPSADIEATEAHCQPEPKFSYSHVRGSNFAGTRDRPERPLYNHIPSSDVGGRQTRFSPERYNSGSDKYVRRSFSDYSQQPQVLGFMRPKLGTSSLDPHALHSADPPVAQDISGPEQIELQGSDDMITSRSSRVRSNEVPGPKPWEVQDSIDTPTQASSANDDARIPTRERVFEDSSLTFIGHDFPLYPNDSDWKEAPRLDRTRADPIDGSVLNLPPPMEEHARRHDFTDKSMGNRRHQQPRAYTYGSTSDDDTAQGSELQNAAQSASPSQLTADENGHTNSAPPPVSYAPSVVSGHPRHIPRPKSIVLSRRLNVTVNPFKEAAQPEVPDEPMVSPSPNRGFAIPSGIIKQGEPHETVDDGTGKRTEASEETEVVERTLELTDTTDGVPPHVVASSPTAEDTSIRHHHRHHPLARISRRSTFRETTRNPPVFSSYQNASSSNFPVDESRQVEKPKPPPSPGRPSLYRPITRDNIPTGPEFPTKRALPIPVPPPRGAMSALYVPHGDSYGESHLYGVWGLDDDSDSGQTSESSFGSPSPQTKSIGPLDWQFAMECQDGQGLFDLDEKRPSLHLHFCPETAKNISPRISELLHSSPTPEQESDDISAKILDTLMMIEYYKTHRAQEEDTWDLMMERAWDAVISALGLSDEEERLEELAGQLRGAMMHAHYVAATGVKDSKKDDSSVETMRCPACDVAWLTTRKFFCPFDHESDETDEFMNWDEFWKHQVDQGHVVCPQEVV
ncbi:hypothetical protein FNYG_08758 [Fusarium nygamai]|uniref:VWFA domain-containing protein n=1 Tax=Gibberella nygamai TaxID=42673 RepID=A0A2K0W6Z6_GIBNY|nr:hypothetical protein FNYG_08758 [Fusarium nygamai]